jgi:hypothetical protein
MLAWVMAIVQIWANSRRVNLGQTLEAHLLDIFTKRSAEKQLWQFGSPRLVLRGSDFAVNDRRMLGRWHLYVDDCRRLHMPSGHFECRLSVRRRLYHK